MSVAGTRTQPLSGLLLWLLLANALLWTLLPWLIHPTLPLDVVEGIFWGQEWQWGYYKHPPLPAWLVNLSFELVGGLGPYLLSQLAILLTLLFVYLLGCRIFDRELALVGVLLLYGVYYFTWPTPEFNHNIAQMPIWAAAVYFFHRALHENRYRDWALLGLVVGLGLLTKYVIAVLVASMFLLMLLRGEYRRRILSWQVAVSLLVLLLVFLPHLLWLIEHEFLPLQYARDRSAAASGSWVTHITMPLKFLSVQLLDHLPLLLILAAAGLLRRGFWARQSRSDGADRDFLLMLALGPALLTALAALLTGMGLRDMWGTPMWNLSGLLLVSYLKPEVLKDKAHRLWRVTAIWLGVLLLLYGLAAIIGNQYKSKPSRTAWPDRALADGVQQQWREVTGCDAIPVVAGDYWLAGLVSLRAEGRPSVLIEGDLALSPWLKEQQIKQQGVLLVWQSSDASVPAMFEDLPAPDAFGQLQLEWRQGEAPLLINWGVVSPQIVCAAEVKE